MLSSNIETSAADAKTLVKGAQDFVRDATSSTVEKADALRTQGLDMLDTAASKARDVQVAALESGKKIAGSTDEFVRANPWTALGIAAGAAALLGAIIARR